MKTITQNIASETNVCGKNFYNVKNIITKHEHTEVSILDSPVSLAYGIGKSFTHDYIKTTVQSKITYPHSVGTISIDIPVCTVELGTKMFNEKYYVSFDDNISVDVENKEKAIELATTIIAIKERDKNAVFVQNYKLAL